MPASIVLKGLDAFKRDLDRLDFSKKKPVLIQGLIKTLEPVRELASGLAPVDTGQLSRDFIVQEAKGSDLASVGAEVGVLRRSFYLFFQEYGTAHHRPQPSLTPALEQSVEQIQNSLADNINEAIDKALTA